MGQQQDPKWYNPATWNYNVGGWALNPIGGDLNAARRQEYLDKHVSQSQKDRFRDKYIQQAVDGRVNPLGSLSERTMANELDIFTPTPSEQAVIDRNADITLTQKETRDLEERNRNSLTQSNPLTGGHGMSDDEFNSRYTDATKALQDASDKILSEINGKMPSFDHQVNRGKEVMAFKAGIEDKYATRADYRAMAASGMRDMTDAYNTAAANTNSILRSLMGSRG